MLQENEVILVLLGSITLLLVWYNFSQIKRIPSSATLLAAYYFLFAGWLLTVFENYMLTEYLNFLEHFCYLTSSILLCKWVLNIVGDNTPFGELE